MNYYRTEKINDHMTLIKSLTGELLYLVEGKEKAALIDTCLGVGHLNELVGQLTDKPVFVLLTHGHVDHALGAPEFENVYMNYKDIDIYKKVSPLSERKNYMMAGLTGKEFEEIEEKDFVAPQPEKIFLPLEDGMKFELGGISIEAIGYPGHTQGSMAFLLEEDRILLLGDACNNSTFLFLPESSSVKKYQNATKKVAKKTKGRYDRVFLSHHVMESGTEIMDNMIELCDEILEGKADDVPFEFMGTQAYIAKKVVGQFERMDGKSGNLIYRKECMI